jgi:hypothetical protein
VIEVFNLTSPRRSQTRVPTGYRLARLLTASRSRLNAEERMFIMCLFADKPALDAAVTWAKRLTKLLRRRAVESL